MVKNQRYALNIPEIESTVSEFAKQLGGVYNVVVESSDATQKVVKISKPRDKKPSILRCYIVNGGQVSFKNEGATAYTSVCNQCRDYLIENAKLEYADRKDYKANNIDEDGFLALIDCFNDTDLPYSVTSKEIHDNKIKYSYTITGQYKDTVTVSYYTNGTLYMQGRISPIFIDFACQATGLLADPASELESLFSVEKSNVEIINEDLKLHIPVNYKYVEGKIETILRPSLLSINRPMTLPDYSLYASPALRALEGIMKKRIIEECGSFDDFGTYFHKEGKTQEYVLRTNSRPFNNEITCKCLEQSYNLFKKHRDAISHVDDTIETTRILSFDESVEIVKECLEKIGNLCKNWN